MNKMSKEELVDALRKPRRQRQQSIKPRAMFTGEAKKATAKLTVDSEVSEKFHKGRPTKNAHVSPAERARRFVETGNIEELGKGAIRTMARRYVPESVLPDLDEETRPAYYRKPKGFSPEQQAKRQQLIKELKELTGDKNYDGVATRYGAEMDSHRWHTAKGGARPADYVRKFSLSGHGHY